jgi:hypothetical protein
MILTTHEFKKVGRLRAESLYNEGYSIWLIPCKVKPTCINGFFGAGTIKPVMIHITDDLNIPLYRDFKERIKYFESGNCCNVLGRYAAFYVW